MKRILAALGLVALTSLVLVLGSSTTAAAAEVASDGPADVMRCKSIVSTMIGSYRDQVVACYFDVASLPDVIPGEYVLEGNEDSAVRPFVTARSDGWSWCGGDSGDSEGGTLWIGPTTLSSTGGGIGQSLGAGQVVYTQVSRPGYTSGSCMGYVTSTPSPEGVCYDNHGGQPYGPLGSANDGISIRLDVANFVIAGNGPASACVGSGRFGAEFGDPDAYTYGDDWFSDWFNAGDAFPEAWFPGGDSGVIPDSVCGEIGVEYTLNGTLLGGAGPFVSDAVVVPGDEVVLSLTYDIANFPSETPATTLLAARVRPNNGMGAAWTPIHPLAVSTGAGTWDIDVSAMYTASHPLALFEMRCADTEGYSYYVDPIWSDDAAENRACSALTLIYPARQDVTTDDVVRIGFRMQPGPFALGDNGITRLESYETTSTTMKANYQDVGDTFDRFGNKVGEYPEDTFPYHIPDDVEGYFDVTIVDDAISTNDIHFRCNDAIGQIDSDGDGVFDCGAPCAIGSDPHDDDFEDCFRSGHGIGLNPASWVPGLVEMQFCVVKVAVIPSPGFVNDWASEQKETLSDVPPFSFGLAMVDFGGDLASEVESPSGTGCFTVGIPVANIDDSEMCVGADISTSGGQRTLIAMFVIVPLILGLLARGFQMLRSP